MIVYISESLNSKKNGGSSISGSDFLNFIRIKYKNATVVTIEPYSDDGEVFYGHKMNSIGKVIVLKREYPILKLGLLRVLKKIFYFVKDFRKVKEVDFDRYYSNDESNIVFVNSWSSLYASKRLKNLEKYKKVCIVRGNPESFVWQSIAEDKEEEVRKAASYLEEFDELVFVSEIGQHAWKKYLKKNIKSYYLPNSIDEVEVERVSAVDVGVERKNLSFSKDEYHIVVVGSIQTRKGQDILLDAIKDIVKEIPNVQVHLVGGVSSLWGGVEIQKKLLNSNFKDYFVFHGHSDKVLSYMHAADLVLFTSRAEAFPRTVAEYMALGKPIVASNVSGVPEMIEHDSNGLLYDPGKPGDLSAHVISLFKNKEKAAKLARVANKDYYDKFSKKRHIQRALEIFELIDS